MATEPEREENPIYQKTFDTLPGQVPQRSDEDIRKDVESILFYDDLVRSYEIKIDVKDGVVTLSGTVNDDMERQRAAEDATRVFGVKQVINNVQLSQQAER